MKKRSASISADRKKQLVSVKFTYTVSKVHNKEFKQN